VDTFLKEHGDNVAFIHCKAGKVIKSAFHSKAVLVCLTKNAASIQPNH